MDRRNISLSARWRRSMLAPVNWTRTCHLAACWLAACWIAGTAAAQDGASPELSADEPIAYDIASGVLTARGHAVFTDEHVRVEADEIRYNRQSSLVEARGAVRVTRADLRLVSEWLTYDARARTFVSGPFRVGRPPLFVEGAAFAGSLDAVDFTHARAYYREPGPWSPALTLESARWLPGKSLRGRRITLDLAGRQLLPLPPIGYAFDGPLLRFQGDLGYRASLGAFARSRTLYPWSENLAPGVNLDLYSRRGVLFGPALSYASGGATELAVDLDSGWIRDLGSATRRRLDLRGLPVPRDRGFVAGGVRVAHERVRLHIAGAWWSDSEVWRDFRPDLYDRLIEPDAFAEFNWLGDDVLVSAFLRYPLANAFGMTERLPEFSIEQLPKTLGATSWYHDWAATLVNYRLHQLAPDPPAPGFPAAAWPAAADPFFQAPGTAPFALLRGPAIQRIDHWQRLQRPIALNSWATFTPLASGRLSYYSRSLDPAGQLSHAAVRRWMGEVGFDLAARAHAHTAWTNRVWDVHGIRHLVRGLVQYRWYPGGGDHADRIAGLDRMLYQPLMPVLDLPRNRAGDSLHDLHLVRIGVENNWQTRGRDGAQRALGELHLYQDLLLSAAPGDPEWQAFYVLGRLYPARWLSLDWEQKIHSETFTLEAARAGLSLRGADVWHARLFLENIDGAIEQYGFDGAWRFIEEYSLLASLRYDARLNSFSRQRYGIRRVFGRTWELEAYVSFRSGDARDDATSIGIRLGLHGY
jgi:LPS-assembly protein